MLCVTSEEFLASKGDSCAMRRELRAWSEEAHKEYRNRMKRRRTDDRKVQQQEAQSVSKVG